MGTTLEGDPRIRARDQPVRAPRRRRPRRQLRQLDRQTGLGNGARLGRPDDHRPARSAVGRDLQYIRINGTLVGGLVGVILHALDML